MKLLEYYKSTKVKITHRKLFMDGAGHADHRKHDNWRLASSAGRRTTPTFALRARALRFAARNASELHTKSTRNAPVKERCET